MEEFRPLMNDRDDEELLEIYVSSNGDWQEEAIKQATKELLNRGYSMDNLNKILCDYQKFQEDEERKYQAELARNATESYKPLKMIIIFFCTPFILIPRLNFFTDMTLSELKQENYKIKYRQRLFLLIGGGIFYMILFRLGFEKGV